MSEVELMLRAAGDVVMEDFPSVYTVAVELTDDEVDALFVAMDDAIALTHISVYATYPEASA